MQRQRATDDGVMPNKTSKDVHMIASAMLIDDATSSVWRSTAVRRTALVINSDPLVARGLAMVLEAEIFDVETAASGVEGVALAAATPFDLIIVGVDLRDMSGLEAMTHLRQADVRSLMVFVSATPATVAGPCMLHLSDGAEHSAFGNAIYSGTLPTRG